MWLGYMGYIPHVRAENMFGKTYGNLTHIAKTDPQASKNFAYSQGRFNSTAKDTFGNPKNTTNVNNFSGLHNWPLNRDSPNPTWKILHLEVMLIRKLEIDFLN
mgnify:FL=1